MNVFRPQDVITSVRASRMSQPDQSTSIPGDKVMERARAGDPEAFAVVVRAHDRGLRTLAYRLVGDLRTDDVLQEAYLKAFRAISRHRGPRGSVPAWLYKVVYNESLDELRRARRQPSGALGSELEILATDPGPDEIAIDRTDLEAALALLTPEQRAAVILVDSIGFDYSEAASILGTRRGTVASRLHHARAALRQVLDHHGTHGVHD